MIKEKNNKTQIKITSKKDSSSQESQLDDIINHPAFNKSKRQAIKQKILEKQIKDKEEKQKLEKRQNKIYKQSKQIGNNNRQSNNNFQEKQGEFQICIQGLSFNAFGKDIRQIFDDCGKITKLKVLTDNNKKSKGTAFATFSTEKQYKKALLKDGVQHMGRYLKIAPGVKKQGSEHNWKQSHTQPKQQNKSQTLFIGNLNFKTNQKDIQKIFLDQKTGDPQIYQKLVDIRIIKDRKTGKSKGMGYIQFADQQISTRAFWKYNNSILNDRHIRLDYADKNDNKNQ